MVPLHMLGACFGFAILGLSPLVQRGESFGGPQAEPPLLLVKSVYHGEAPQDSPGSVRWFHLAAVKCGLLGSEGAVYGRKSLRKALQFVSSTIQ